jgi:hypothetical protein
VWMAILPLNRAAERSKNRQPSVAPTRNGLSFNRNRRQSFTIKPIVFPAEPVLPANSCSRHSLPQTSPLRCAAKKLQANVVGHSLLWNCCRGGTTASDNEASLRLCASAALATLRGATLEHAFISTDLGSKESMTGS